MMLDSERRKVLQKKGVSHKNPITTHKDHEKKYKKQQKEIIRTTIGADGGPYHQKNKGSKKGNHP